MFYQYINNNYNKNLALKRRTKIIDLYRHSKWIKILFILFAQILIDVEYSISWLCEYLYKNKIQNGFCEVHVSVTDFRKEKSGA